MNTIVISDKLFNKKLQEENIEKFRQEIGEGKYDSILFSSTREIAFPDGIVMVDKKSEGELPLFTFSCAPWECVQDDGIPFLRDDGITFCMVLDDEKPHNFTVATYEDYIVNGKTLMKRDDMDISYSSKPMKIVKVFTHADEDMSKVKVPETLNGLFALSVLCEIQREALRMPEKIEKAREFNEIEKDNGNKEKLENKDGLNQDDSVSKKRRVNLNNHIVYQYENKDNNVHKEFIRRCEVWAVRGHYRICKSGKIVYVKPHLKGKKRDEARVSDIVYTLDER